MKPIRSEQEWFESSRLKVKDVMTVMTRTSCTVAPEVSIFQARKVMKDYRIRHLPVVSGGELLGLVSDRDIRTAETFHGPGYLTVGDAMTEKPYTVLPDESLQNVLTVMIQQKRDSALIVTSGGALIGIFTSHDALEMLRALVLLAERERGGESGSEAA